MTCSPSMSWSILHTQFESQNRGGLKLHSWVRPDSKHVSPSTMYHEHLKCRRHTAPASKSIVFLVWGASSSVGRFVVQLAHWSGFHVIRAASQKSFGANEVLDYWEESTSAKIRELTAGKLKHAVDCISGTETRSLEGCPAFCCPIQVLKFSSLVCVVSCSYKLSSYSCLIRGTFLPMGLGTSTQ